MIGASPLMAALPVTRVPGDEQDEGPHSAARKDANDQQEPALCFAM